MYPNEYNLRELLELALRVPEVGAVNFNILYHILKTIIQKEGIADVKPDFCLQVPCTTSSNDSTLKDSLRRSYSVDSLTSCKVLKETESEEDFPEKTHKYSAVKESEKWQKILFSKRIGACEEEISELHALLAKLDEKISNSEKVIDRKDRKMSKQITEMHHLLESKEDNHSLAQKFEEISSQVSMMSKWLAKSKQTKEREDKLTSIDSDLTDKDEDANKLAKATHYKEKDKEETAKKPTKSTHDEEQGKKHSKKREDEVKCIDSHFAITDVDKDETAYKPTKSPHDKGKDQDIVYKIEKMNREIFLLKKQLETVQKS